MRAMYLVFRLRDLEAKRPALPCSFDSDISDMITATF